MEIALATVVASGIGMMAVYAELHSCFRSRGIAASGVFGHFPSLAFIAGNGLLAAVCLHLVPPEWMATTLGIDELSANAPARAVVIGLALPALLRSRVATVGEGKDPVGPALIYDLLFSRTAASLIHHFHTMADERITHSLDQIAANDPEFRSNWEERAWKIVRSQASATGASDAEIVSLRKKFESEVEYFEQIEQTRRSFLADVFAWAATKAGVDVFFDRIDAVIKRGGEVNPDGEPEAAEVPRST